MTLFEIFRGRSPGQIQAKTSITEVLDLIPKMTHPIQLRVKFHQINIHKEMRDLIPEDAYFKGIILDKALEIGECFENISQEKERAFVKVCRILAVEEEEFRKENIKSLSEMFSRILQKTGNRMERHLWQNFFWDLVGPVSDRLEELWPEFPQFREAFQKL